MNISNIKPETNVAGKWSDGAEVLSVYAGMDSSTWKLGLLSSFNNELLTAQINALVENSDLPNPFFNTSFLSASVDTIGNENMQFLFLSETIGEQETLKMFAPVILTKQGILQKPVLKIWTNLYTPLGLPLFDATDNNTIDVLINCLNNAQHKEAVAILLDLIPKQSEFTQKLYISNLLCKKLHRFSYTARAMLKPSMPADYLKTKLSGKRKQRLKKGMNELKGLGDVAFYKATSGAEIVPHFEEFLLLEAGSWKGKRGTSLKDLKQTSTFARKAVQNMNKENQCSIYTLRLDDKAIASLVVFSDNGYFFPWKIAFDEDYARYSPGNNLLAHVNQELFGMKGFKGIDSLAAESNKTAQTFWPDQLELYSIAIGIGKNAEADAAFLAREVYLQKRIKCLAKEILGIFSRY